MGKTRNRRHKGLRANPTGLPSMRDIEREEAECPSAADEGSIPNTIQNILDKLQNPTVEEQECACWTISALATQEEAIKHLLRHNLIKTVAPLMNSSSAVLRHSSTSALRNLSDHGNEVCDMLVKEDVMTSLVHLLKTYSEIWQPTDERRDRVDSKKEIFIEATHLLWNLCESNEQAVTIFNRENLIEILSKYMSVATYSTKLVTVVAHCLHAVTEDNPETQLNLLESPFYEQLTKLLSLQSDDPNTRLICALTTGIVLNLHGGKLASCSTANIQTIMKVISDVLSVDTLPQLNDLSEGSQKKNLSQASAQNGSTETTVKNGTLDDDKTEQQDEGLDCVLTAQQVALEVLANICCSDDGIDEWTDTSDSCSNESEDISDEGTMESDVDFTKNSVLPSLHEAIVSLDLIQKVLSKLTPASVEIMENLKKSMQGKRMLKNFMITQCRALCCLQNLVSCLDIEDFGGPSEMYNLWIKLGKDTVALNEPDISLLEAATGAMRSVIEKIAANNSSQIENISPDDLNLLCGIFLKCSDGNVQINIIRIAGTLGTAVWSSNHTEKIPFIKRVALFLLEILNGRELWVEAEALDAIFDVFAEDDLDALALEIELVEKLNHLVPSLKQKISANKKTLGDHYPVVITARDNLLRFIKYKTKYRQSHSCI